MKPMKKLSRLIFTTLLLALLFTITSYAGESQAQLHSQAGQLLKDGNYAEALEIYEKLCSNLETDPKEVGTDLNNAVFCLQSLNRTNEQDALIEKVIATHKHNWRLLRSAARIYNHNEMNLQRNTCYGYIIAGEFQRGQHRGGGKYVNSYERDRARAQQLMVEAMAIIESREKPQEELQEIGQFYIDFARILRRFSRGAEWRLQLLTDLTTLPDYEEGHYYRSDRRSAPVDADGKPVFYYVPESFEAAQSDGERYRWCLQQATATHPDSAVSADMEFAQFLQAQFGVQTLRDAGISLPGGQDEEKQAGIFALATLGEDETIASLANGVLRFKLPEEFNYIHIYHKYIENYQGSSIPSTLAGIFENRQQYDRALEYWKIYKTCTTNEIGIKNAAHRISQIMDNWGVFEPVTTHPAGQGATVDYRFRNGSEVEFIAYHVKYQDLINDIKEYLKGSPREYDWDKINPNNIGRRLVFDNQTKYLGEEAVKWTLELQPREKHFDRRITVTTPLQEAGVYLLLAKMKDGNTSRIIIWVNDTVIVKKLLNNQTLYYVADAITGKPVAKANLEFFGWDHRRSKLKAWEGEQIVTQHFAEYSDENGQVMLGEKNLPSDYQWFVTATTQDGRRAWLGFSRVWHYDYHDEEYKERKVLFLTDRPVYRPEQTVKFKAWRRQTQYDQQDVSQFAEKPLTVKIYDPKNEKIFEKQYISDAYGGIAGEIDLPEDATLGEYRLVTKFYEQSHTERLGGNTFRVEEYKKPEYEVKINAPEKPIMLGEKVTATVEANYYFGAPVVNAEVKYKVLRYPHEARWFPAMPWDWFYGSGYWWFSYDYYWYPGWREWGCRCPFPWWQSRHTEPEVVLENEAAIGPDGKLAITIDTALAKELHGDTDHRYEITAEVRDESRRTIVGTGTVLVARKPFSVSAWVNRGYFRVGDTIRAGFKAQTLDRKPVTGQGKLRLLKINYGQEMQPVETEVQAWELDPDAGGNASQQIQASRAGQYRLSYTVIDPEGHTIEGGYLFVVRGEGFDGKEFRFDNIELITDQQEYAPGDEVKLMINTNLADSSVLLFLRPSNGVYLKPKLIRMQGKSTVEAITVTKKDMPNFFIEAVTIADGKLYTAMREVIVPPEKRVLNVEVLTSAEKYKPGEKGKVKVKVTGYDGKPYAGSVVITVYDKSVEYISGGSNIPEIKEFYWKWRRRHYASSEHNLDRFQPNLLEKDEIAMANLGVFGHLVADEDDKTQDFAVFNRGFAAGA
ncbi:MAG: alpha-2-macroglobulin, partial [Planctomycetes bacterium]|nr:alpha-2-macroglobulin [Planctomycetota bacterium]